LKKKKLEVAGLAIQKVSNGMWPCLTTDINFAGHECFHIHQTEKPEQQYQSKTF
jgi:hypothetical protein